MDSLENRYYITFDSYEEAIAMHDDLDNRNIKNAISPAPLDLVEGVCCGVSLMIEEVDKDKVDKYLNDTKFKYLKFVKAHRSFIPKRDKYC